MTVLAQALFDIHYLCLLIKVWKKAGNQGDGWYRGYHNFTDLIKNKTTFTVSFEASRGPTSASDIAIDDITFSPCTHGK